MSEKFHAKFRINNGNRIEVAIGLFWEKLSESDIELGHRAREYHAIRIYSTEDAHSSSPELRHEYIAGIDYDPQHVPAVSDWLASIVADRRHGDYDEVELFLDDLAETLARAPVEGDDLVSHIHDPSLRSDPAMLGFEADDVPEDENPDETPTR